MSPFLTSSASKNIPFETHIILYFSGPIIALPFILAYLFTNNQKLMLKVIDLLSKLYLFSFLNHRTKSWQIQWEKSEGDEARRFKICSRRINKMLESLI
jgi:hypothetical protein